MKKRRVLNIWICNNRGSKFQKQKLTEPIVQIDKSTIPAANFHNPLSVFVRTSKENTNRQ